MSGLSSVAGLIACKDAALFNAFSCSGTPPSTFYKLLEIERAGFMTAVYTLLTKTEIYLATMGESM
jgi:hypothetical protein